MNIVKAIADMSTEAANEVVNQQVDAIIEKSCRAVFKHPSYPFIVGAQLWLMESGMDGYTAWNTARDAVAQFLKEENIAFGHKDYSWDARAGRELAQELFTDR